MNKENPNSQIPPMVSSKADEEVARDVLQEDMEPFFRAVDEGTGALFALGRLWARHGLRVAELALQTSAQTLRTTAGVLSGIEEQLASEQDATAHS